MYHLTSVYMISFLKRVAPLKYELDHNLPYTEAHRASELAPGFLSYCTEFELEKINAS